MRDPDKEMLNGSSAMDMFRSAWSPRVAFSWLLWTSIAVYVFFGLVAVPIHVPRVADHDLGALMALEYYFVSGSHFGTDIIQNAGPYGFLFNGRFTGGMLHYQKIAGSICFSAAFAGLTVWIVRRYLTNWLLALWFVAAVAIYAFFNEEAAIKIFYMIAAVYLARLRHVEGRSRYWSVPVLAVMSLFALTKVVYLFYWGLVVLGVAALALTERRKGFLCFLGGTAFATLLLFWVAAGQSVGDIVPFVRGALDFSNVYGDALAVWESWPTALIGAFTLFLVGILLISTLLASIQSRNAEQVVLSLVFGAAIFLAWKHGFVRADPYHLHLFFGVVVPAVPLVLGMNAGCRNWAYTFLSVCLAIASAGLAIGGIEAFGAWKVPTTAMLEMRSLTKPLMSVDELTTDVFTRLEANKKTAREEFAWAASIVGKEGIDEFGMRPGIPLMADMTYKPRPMPIRFAALGKYMEEANAAFYRDPARAPKFVLMTNDTIDYRFLPPDDAAANLELLANYQVRALNQPYILLERRDAPPASLTFTPVKEVVAGFDQPLELPRSTTGYLWACVDISASPLGRLTRFVYKLPEVEISLTGSQGNVPGWPRRGRFIPVKDGSCFLANPLVMNFQDYIAGSRGEVEPSLVRYLDPHVQEAHRMQFSLPLPKLASLFQPEIKVSFFSVAGLPSTPAIPPQVMTDLLRKQIGFERLPLRVETPFPFQPHPAYGQTVAIAHAPAKLTFAKQVEDRSISFSFAMTESSFKDGGNTDGTDFTLTFVPNGAGARPQVLFQRTLTPLSRPEDRGMQRTTVMLPQGAHGTVELIIGTLANPGWDRTVVGNVAFGR